MSAIELRADAPRQQLSHILFSTVLALALSGCAPLYLHKDAYEKETAEVKSSVDKLDVATAYKQLGADAEALAKAEDKAVLDALQARRNLILVGLVDPGPGLLSDADQLLPATSRLQVFLEADIEKLTPKNAINHGSRELAQSFAEMEKTERHVATYTKLLSSAYRKLPPSDGKTTSGLPKAYRSCRDVPPDQAETTDLLVPLPYDPSVDEAENKSRIEKNNGALKKLCVARAHAWSKLAELLQALAPAEDQSPPPPGLIAAAALWLADAFQRQKDAMKDAEALSGKLEELLKSLSSNKEVVDLRDLDEFIKKNLKGTADLLQVAGWSKLLEFMQCGLLADLRTEVNKSNGEAAGDKEKDDAKASTACEAGKAGIQIGQDGKGNAAVISVAKLLIQFQKDAKTLDVLERVNANILAIADLRHKLDVAKAGADLENSRIVLLHARLHALLDELADVRRSKETLTPILTCKSTSFSALVESGCDGTGKDPTATQRATFALMSYVQSWNRGQIPAEVMNYRLIQARRTYDITIAGQTANNYKQLIQPMIDALAAYGAGGIPPELVGQLLGNAAIAAGVFGIKENAMNIGTSLGVLGTLLCLAGCAGQEAAREVATKASSALGDLKSHMSGSIEIYKGVRNDEYANLADLDVVTATTKVRADEHASVWTATDAKRSLALFNSIGKAATEDALLQSAPFDILRPPPLFVSPQVDEKGLNDLIKRLTEIARRPTLVERLNDWADYIVLVNKSFEETTKNSGNAQFLGPDHNISKTAKICLGGDDAASPLLLAPSNALPSDAASLPCRLQLLTFEALGKGTQDRIIGGFIGLDQKGISAAFAEPEPKVSFSIPVLPAVGPRSNEADLLLNLDEPVDNGVATQSLITRLVQP